MHLLLLFASSFSVVFLLVFQQMNVQIRAHGLASITSLFITLAQVVVFRGMVLGGAEEVTVMACGGVLGVNVSMVSHGRMLKWMASR